MAADSSDDKMILRIETEQGLPASELAELLDALDAAFRQFSKRRISRDQTARLRVYDVRHGSLEVILDAVDAAGKLIEAGTLLAPFASHLMDLASAICGLQPPKVSRSERKVIEAISNPIANDNATQINLIVHGDVHFTFDADSVAALRVSQAASADLSSRVPEIEAPIRYVTTGQVRSLVSDGVHGTALDVDGEWYARLEGGHGVLVPITAAGNVTETLRHKSAYLFKGSLQKGERGEQIGIYVTELITIGS